MTEAASATRSPARPVRRSSPSRLSARHHLEPNPFEKSFSSGPSESSRSHDGSDRRTDIKADHSRNNSASTPLSTRPGAAYRDRTQSTPKSQTSSANQDAASTPKPLLPPVASITSPASETSQYPWATGLTSSLRSGPLSPAMLAGPQSAHFDPNNFRTGFTPDLSNFKTGLTPLGGGPISFPPPSPNTAAFLAAMVNNTPGASTSAATITLNTLSALSGHPAGIDPPNASNGASMSSQPQNFAGRPLDSHDTFDLAFSRTFGGDKQQAGSKLKDSVASEAGSTVSPSVSPQTMQRPLGADQQQASQAASGLFLLSQAQQEISKREDADGHQRSNGATVAANAPTSLYESNNAKGGKGAAAKGGKATKRKKGAEDNKGQSTTAGTAGGKKQKTKKGSSEAPDGPPDFQSKSSAYSGEDHMEFDSGDESGDGDGKGEDRNMDEKRKNFLERNRQAALKCRQRKKAWLASLQAKVEYLQNDNENLQNTVGALRNEVMFLKSQLVQAQGGAPQSMSMGMGMGLPMVSHGHPDHHTMPQPGMGISAGMGPHPAYMHPGASAPPSMSQGPNQAGIYSAHAVPRPSHMPNNYGQDARDRPRSEGEVGREGGEDVKMPDQPSKHEREWNNSVDPTKNREMSTATIKV